MPTGSPRPTDARPPVSVIVPFAGDRAGAARTIAALRRLDLGDGDEVRIADNSPGGVLASSPPNGVEVVRAAGERSSYHARNAAARGARGDWLLFLDADCVPDCRLIEAYFTPPPPPECALLAGDIGGDGAQRGLLPRYARARNHLGQGAGGSGMIEGAAATANLLVRRAAFEPAGGFAEGIRSGGDVDLCRRLLGAGWTLEHRPGAAVIHPHQETLAGLLRQVARYGAGARWLDRRHPGSAPRWPLIPGLLGSARDVASNVARGRFEEAGFRAVDAFGLVAHNVGYMSSNRAGALGAAENLSGDATEARRRSLREPSAPGSRSGSGRGRGPT